MGFGRLLTRTHQLGGLRLFIEYAKLGVFRGALKSLINCMRDWQALKSFYPVMLKTVEPYLEKRYIGSLQDGKKRIDRSSLEHRPNKTIWFCWLQGIEQAPSIVLISLASLKQHLADREIKVIDNSNWEYYVKLPEYIVKKWKKRRIPAALFSDLLRLELLINYGGTWIDATVLCTGFDSPATQKYRDYLDTDLFLFQYTPPGTAEGISISNWFITSCTNNEVLMVLRDMLYAYWKDYDCTLDYYIFHLFFEMVAREYPEKIAAMPYGRSQNSIALMLNWEKTFKQEKWDNLVSKVSFHKLSYRVPKDVKNNKSNYFNHILNGLREG